MEPQNILDRMVAGIPCALRTRT